MVLCKETGEGKDNIPILLNKNKDWDNWNSNVKADIRSVHSFVNILPFLIIFPIGNKFVEKQEFLLPIERRLVHFNC